MFEHYADDSKLDKLREALDAAEYRLDDAIRANGVGHELNKPARDAVGRAYAALDARLAQLDKEHGIDADAEIERVMAAHDAGYFEV